MITQLIITFILGLLFVQFSKKIAIKYDIVDRPNSAIKTHTKVTPYLGGLGIILTFFTSFLIFNPVELNIKHMVELISLFAIFMLGFLDDKNGLKITTRLIVQM